MKIKTPVLAIILFITIFGGIYASDISGLWKTESTKVAGTIKTGTSVGEKNPLDIKGSFSFSDVNKNFDVSVSDLQKAFEIKNVDNMEAFKVKDLETYYGTTLSNEIGTGSLRYFVALYKGIDYKVTEETYLPEAAVKMLKDKGNLTKEQIEYLDKHTVKINK